MRTGNHKFLFSPQALAEFVAAWEACTLTKADWTHAAHVAVGSYYVVRHPWTAFEWMKSGIIRHNEAVGTVNSDTSGYHETLTRLWIDVLARFAGSHGYTDTWNAACAAVRQFGETRDLHRLYYSFDVVRSIEARRRWIAPDLTPESDAPLATTATPD